MPKLVSHEDGVLVYEALRRWKRDGHEVALMRVSNKEAPGCTGLHLMCECDFDVEDYVKDGKVVGKIHTNDSHKCKAMKAVRRYVVRTAHRKNVDRWCHMGLKESILDIHRRAKEDEFFGQHVSDCVYTQEVARLLGRTHGDVLKACGELYAEERLDLNGCILTDYVPRFRFPVEMASIMRYVVEEPLGWPNGDAGDGWVAELEADVQERLGFKSGKEAFGKHWPSIDLLVLAEFGLEPVAAVIRFLISTAENTSRPTDLVLLPCNDALVGLREKHPDISPASFLEFMHALLRLSCERVEMDRQRRIKKVPPEQTLREMAEYFEKVAANFRAQAKKG